MVMDILSVPTMSDDLKRVFFGVKRTILWDRARLSPAYIKQLECLNSWVQNDLIWKLYVIIKGDRVEVSDDERG